MKKYKLTKNKNEYLGTILYQIQALKDFGDVRKGDLGGWIEREENLSQEGNCWVSGNAWVYGNACVSDNAWVYGNAEVSGDTRVYGNACVSGDAKVSGDAEVSGDAKVYKKIKLVGGYFYHTKRKNEQIEKVGTYDDDYETLACNPKIEQEEKVGKKVKIRLSDNQIVEGEII